jgi:hypothetical protein
MSKLIKKLENETDYIICVFKMNSGKFVVTIYDYVSKTHDKQGSYDDYNEALSAAKSLNNQYKINENTVKLTESKLKQIVAESVKKVLSESYWSGGEYYEDQEEMYIGRTSAYYGYDDDDDNIYEPDYWTYDEDPNCKEFAGEVYALNADGISELNWWLNCQRSNEYQRRNTFNHNNMSREQMWNHLTDPSSHLSTLVRE